MINTLPHALLPWKASESLMLGRPFIVERSPLVEMPEPFLLRPNVHYLEMFPGFGDFDDNADIEDPHSYRMLDHLHLDQFREGAEKIAGCSQGSGFGRIHDGTGAAVFCDNPVAGFCG